MFYRKLIELLYVIGFIVSSILLIYLLSLCCQFKNEIELSIFNWNSLKQEFLQNEKIFIYIVILCGIIGLPFCHFDPFRILLLGYISISAILTISSDSGQFKSNLARRSCAIGIFLFRNIFF